LTTNGTKLVALRRVLVAALAAVALTPIVTVVGASPASAATNQFKGMNWAVLGDNFSTTTLVLRGLSSSDSYATVKAKANSLYNAMAPMGVNTVRLPVNASTVGTSWWSSYRGTIDAATERGWKVILGYWEDQNASGGKITNVSAWNAMWTTVINAYGGNGNVYLEPMNEPHGYSSADWRNLAASWLTTHTGANKSRVLIGGTGYSQDLRDLCGDSRFSSTLFSFHIYTFFYGTNDAAGWQALMKTRLGTCANRAVVTEFGAQMDNGLNFASSTDTTNFVTYLRGVTQVMRDNQMGGSYWPALGGKPGPNGYDPYSMFSMGGSGTNLTLTVRNASGRDRVRYGWGL
jgi:hypothetical protein